MRRRVVFVAFPELQALDLVGPAEVFSLADRFHGDSYGVEVAASSPNAVRSSSGLKLHPTRSLRSCRGEIDTLVAVGGAGVPAALEDEGLVRWIARAAGRSRRVCSVCNGAFLLAAAGLLDGRRATTHWAACDELARRHPAITVERDPIFVRDGSVATSAGVTAGMDLALALVEEDLGREASLAVARALVLFVRRPGGQAQFSAQLATQAADRRPLRELQGWMTDHLEADLSVPALGRPRAHEPAQLRPRVPSRGGDDAGRLRRGVARRARAHRARGLGGDGRAGGPQLRLRNRRDHAPRLPPPPRRRARGVSQPLRRLITTNREDTP